MSGEIIKELGEFTTKVREALGTMAEYRKEFEQKWDNLPFNKLPKFNPKLKCNLRETVYGLYYEGRREQHSKDPERSISENNLGKF